MLTKYKLRMPRIKPFYALKPAAHLQNSVVTRPLENYSLGQARLMASENPFSFLHLINPELDNPYLRGSRQELVFKKINENFDYFLERKVLLREDKPSMFIYRVAADGLVQSGLWTVTHISDYLNGNIKKHELTVERREKLLAEYLQQTGLDANPVLITYPPDNFIDGLIAKYQETKPQVDFNYQDGSKHQLWLVDEAGDLNSLMMAFERIQTVYIADGHHRIASVAKMAQKSGNNYFSTAYFSTKQIQILEFNRLVKDLNSFSVVQFLDELAKYFFIEPVEYPVKAAAIHEFGMYLAAKWYVLKAKPLIINSHDPISALDVSILQDYVLKPILKIDDPRTDARIAFEGGKTSLETLQAQVDHGNYAVAFTLFPTSVQQLIAVAEVNGVMPPKSTWVEPKFLVGMVINQLS
jgi:uncharacterized protein (DUF1015 family)